MVDKQKRIKFWLIRTQEELLSKAKENIDKASLLGWQRNNFSKMRMEVQQKVIEDLLEDMSKIFNGETLDRFKKELMDDED